MEHIRLLIYCVAAISGCVGYLAGYLHGRHYLADRDRFKHLAQIKLQEAEWWVPLVPNGISPALENQRDRRIAELEQEAGSK